MTQGAAKRGVVMFVVAWSVANLSFIFDAAPITGY